MRCLDNKGMDLIGFALIMFKYHLTKKNVLFTLGNRVARKREKKEETEGSGHLLGTWYLAGSGEGSSIHSSH